MSKRVANLILGVVCAAACVALIITAHPRCRDVRPALTAARGAGRGGAI